MSFLCLSFNTTLTLEFQKEEKIQFIKSLVYPTSLRILTFWWLEHWYHWLSPWMFLRGCNSQKAKTRDLIQIQNEYVPKVFFSSLVNKETIIFKM